MRIIDLRGRYGPPQQVPQNPPAPAGPPNIYFIGGRHTPPTPPVAPTPTVGLTPIVPAVPAAGPNPAVFTLVVSAPGVAAGTQATITFAGLPAGVTTQVAFDATGVHGPAAGGGFQIPVNTGVVVNFTPAPPAVGGGPAHNFTVTAQVGGQTATANGQLTLT